MGDISGRTLATVTLVSSPLLLPSLTGAAVQCPRDIFPLLSPQLGCGQTSLWLGQTKDKGEVEGIVSFLLSCHGHTSTTTDSSTAGTYRAAQLPSPVSKGMQHTTTIPYSLCAHICFLLSGHTGDCKPPACPQGGWAGLGWEG